MSLTPSLLRVVIRELRRNSHVAGSPLAGELAKVIENLRKQWLPDHEEKETRLDIWRFLNAFLGSVFFFVFLSLTLFVDNNPYRGGAFVGTFGLIDIASIEWLVMASLGGLLFASLIFFQRGRAGPVGVFLGGVGLLALAFWITRSTLA